MLLNNYDIEQFLRPSINGKVARYPLTDMGIDKDDILHIDIAVAGFTQDDITITQVGNQLHVNGKSSNEKPDIQYIQKHISINDFSRILVLHENYVGGDVSASMKNGILKITVKPKAEMTKNISIEVKDI